MISQLKMFDKALIDIEFATEGNFPAAMRAELKKRKKISTKLIAAGAQVKLYQPKLDVESHAMFPGIAVLNVEFFFWIGKFKIVCFFQIEFNHFATFPLKNLIRCEVTNNKFVSILNSNKGKNVFDRKLHKM